LEPEASDGRRPREDVKCFMVETADGEKCVVVERIDGKRWRFERKTLDFELRCDAAALTAWLDGLSDQQMPGLLTLLAAEVGEIGAKLKASEQERDALRGSEDYDYFGLNGVECSDRDLERAYRKLSTQLHPDKGGDERSFAAMRERYENLKAARGGASRKGGGGGGPIRWDPNCRTSMLQAHSDLREQLVWITKLIEEVEQEKARLLRRQAVRGAILDGDAAQHADAAAAAAAIAAT